MSEDRHNLAVLIVILVGLAIIGTLIIHGIYAGVQKTQIKADASVAIAQEKTRRAEGRHELIDLLGWIRGKEDQRHR